MTFTPSITVSQQIGQLHNSFLESMLPQLVKNPSRKYIYRFVTNEAIQRGWLQPEKTQDFMHWLQNLATDSRAPGFLNTLSVSEPTRSYLKQLTATVKQTGAISSMKVAVIVAKAKAIPKPSALSEKEALIVDTALSVLKNSATFWSQTAKTVVAQSLDGGEILDADMIGAIGGLAGAAITTWWSGPLSAGAATAAGVAGAVIGSAFEYLFQDEADDAKGELAIPTEGSEGYTPAE